MSQHLHYLYHFCDPKRTAGFGFDGYIGTTDDPDRRCREHLTAACARRHANKRFQRLYDRSGGCLEMRLIWSANCDEIFATEALVLPKPNMHVNKQAGGGRLRSLPEEALVKIAGVGANLRFLVPEYYSRLGAARSKRAVMCAATGIVIACGIYESLASASASTVGRNTGGAWHKPVKGKTARQAKLDSSVTRISPDVLFTLTQYAVALSVDEKLDWARRYANLVTFANSFGYQLQNENVSPDQAWSQLLSIANALRNRPVLS